jgi:hypothetical protein
MDCPAWEPLNIYTVSISVIRIEQIEVARVIERVDGKGWLSQVNRHQRGWNRRLYAIAPSERTAKRWAERWMLANLDLVRTQLPVSVRGPAGVGVSVWPESNPVG